MERACAQSLNLSAESVQGASLALERVDDVHRRDGLPARVLRVGDGITDDVLEENLEDSAGLLVDEAGDALDTATTGEAADRGLGDALDVVAKHLAVALGAALPESLSSFSASRHDKVLRWWRELKVVGCFKLEWAEKNNTNSRPREWGTMIGCKSKFCFQQVFFNNGKK